MTRFAVSTKSSQCGDKVAIKVATRLQTALNLDFCVSINFSANIRDTGGYVYAVNSHTSCSFNDRYFSYVPVELNIMTLIIIS